MTILLPGLNERCQQLVTRQTARESSRLSPSSVPVIPVIPSSTPSSSRPVRVANTALRRHPKGINRAKDVITA
ncbi:MAG TPA: hypothetical protein VE778_05430 [Candidatus Bathyarchaeia archaeon]|nr:hypothetical protein [Candidatus Bathyarchaeia archaeon]